MKLPILPLNIVRGYMAPNRAYISIYQTRNTSLFITSPENPSQMGTHSHTKTHEPLSDSTNPEQSLHSFFSSIYQKTRRQSLPRLHFVVAPVLGTPWQSPHWDKHLNLYHHSAHMENPTPQLPDSRAHPFIPVQYHWCLILPKGQHLLYICAPLEAVSAEGKAISSFLYQCFTHKEIAQTKLGLTPPFDKPTAQNKACEQISAQQVSG